MKKYNDSIIDFLIVILLIIVVIFFLVGVVFAASDAISSEVVDHKNVKALYLTSDTVRNNQKMKLINKLIDETKINGVVVDVKVDRPQLDDKLKGMVADLNKRGVWTIARIVVMQDSWLAKKRPDIAIKNKDGDFWHSGKKSWRRYWVDPANLEVADYNAEIAKRAVDMGFKEIQFDYIRFPSDGNMKNISYPHYDGKISKYEVMGKFFERLTGPIRKYNPQVILSIDIFGEAYFNGKEPGVGQRMSDIEKYFDVISPMNYPSHFCCGEFGFCDPNQHPYSVMYKSLNLGVKYISRKNVIIRPWVQAFSIGNIYNCKCKDHKSHYGSKEIDDQIRAIHDNGLSGFMLWNGSSRYNEKVLMPALKD